MTEDPVVQDEHMEKDLKSSHSSSSESITLASNTSVEGGGGELKDVPSVGGSDTIVIDKSSSSEVEVPSETSKKVKKAKKERTPEEEEQRRLKKEKKRQAKKDQEGGHHLVQPQLDHHDNHHDKDKEEKDVKELTASAEQLKIANTEKVEKSSSEEKKNEEHPQVPNVAVTTIKDTKTKERSFSDAKKPDSKEHVSHNIANSESTTSTGSPKKERRKSKDPPTLNVSSSNTGSIGSKPAKEKKKGLLSRIGEFLTGHHNNPATTPANTNNNNNNATEEGEPKPKAPSSPKSISRNQYPPPPEGVVGLKGQSLPSSHGPSLSSSPASNMRDSIEIREDKSSTDSSNYSPKDSTDNQGGVRSDEETSVGQVITKDPSTNLKDSKDTKDPNNNNAVVATTHRPHESSGRKLRFSCTKVEDLPKDLKKIVKGSKVPDEVFEKDFQALLNILHFITKKVYVTTSSTRTPGTGTEASTTGTTPTTGNHLKVPAPASTGGNSDATTQNSSGNYNLNSGAKENTNNASNEKPSKEEKPTPGVESPESRMPSKNISEPKKIAVKVPSGMPIDADIFITNKNPKDLYRSLKKTGRGGFGTVFAAKSVADGKKVAIKRVHHVTNKEKIDNYNEAKYAMKCGDHPNIVKMLQAYEYKEECWMVMEFLEGGTLTEARRGHEFEEKEIAYVAKELLKGLAHLHSINLVHRDVKSENIMMSIMGDIKLIDFGLCSDASLIRPCMVGSPYWMPPEMLNRKMHSFPTDIWSFGISLLELANKNPPNSQNKIKVMFTTATQGRPQPFEEPNKWSEHFRDFIGKCLEKDPQKRSTADELLKHPFLEQAANTRRVMRKILSEIFLQKAIGLM